MDIRWIKYRKCHYSWLSRIDLPRKCLDEATEKIKDGLETKRVDNNLLPSKDANLGVYQ